MAENKFIKHLKGTETAGSVLEIKNQGTPATFGNMPAGTSNPNTVYADARGDATAVLKGTDVWKLNSSTLDLASRVYGDGRDFTDTYTASGSSLWVNATHTFDSAKIFGANTKWVLKLCGANLLSAVADTIDFSLIIKFGSTAVVAKNFTVAEQANNFCQQFVIDFNEWTQNVIKATSGDTMTIQLLCGDSTASATIYNGMTTLTALQRRVDGDVVASDTSTFDDLEQGLAGKVDKTSTPSVVYGTDATGAQTTYDLDELGGVTDVQIDGVSIVQDKIADIPMSTYLGDYVLKTGDTMSGALKFDSGVGSTQGGITGYTHGVLFFASDWDRESPSINPLAWLSEDDGFVPFYGGLNLGATNGKWTTLYVQSINNGYDIAVPVTNSADTLALKSEVDLAANSGDQLTAKGVWYAKMYAATVPPAATDGTNYADFSQVDGNGDPVIVIYERQSGAWVQTQTITPPASYNGYVTVTSKIWDIVEQAGQQGGKVLWSHNQKTFTPYPQIISFEDVALTGNSTVAMPLSPTNDNITNKGYVDSAISGALVSFSPWDLFDFKWKDCTMSRTGWALSDGNWINKADAETAYQHFIDEINPNINYCRWDSANSTHIYTRYVDPAVGDEAFTDTSLSTSAGTIESIGVGYITIGGINYNYQGYYGWTAQYDTTPSGWALYYHVASDGHKITAPDPIVDTMYSETGVAWYYVVDIANQRFKLPRKTSMEIVRSVQNNDGSWYNLYANGRVEQGGRATVNNNGTNDVFTMLIEMADTNYTIVDAKEQGDTAAVGFNIEPYTTTQFKAGVAYPTGLTRTFGWVVYGMSALDMTNEKNGQKYLYFYVGA